MSLSTSRLAGFFNNRPVGSATHVLNPPVNQRMISCSQPFESGKQNGSILIGGKLFNSNDLITLAKQMKNLSASKVRTLTVPMSNTNYIVPGLGSTVKWNSVLAAELFHRLATDQAVIDVVKASPSPSATKKAKPKIVDKFGTRTAAENPCGVLK